MSNKDITHKSKFLSLVLRHKPEEIELRLDQNGWTNVKELLEKSGNKGINISFDQLLEIVDTNDKKRFIFNEDKTKIRANQGHSIDVDVELIATTPPAILYHGTAIRFLESILQHGIQKQNRLHVHLSQDIDTAITVGQRHGKHSVLAIDASRMIQDGIKFYLSENKVWLTDFIQPQYILSNE